MKTFQPGQTVWLVNAGERCEIKELLGTGGRGHVYRAMLQDQEYAIKWLFPATSPERQRADIELLTEKGPPNDRFLWPMDVALCQDYASFGYLMPLRPARFRSLADLMNREIDPSFRTLIGAALDLVDSFLRLHSLGLCYSDISFGTVFLDPNTGEVAIGGGDGVSADGEGLGDVLGTPQFMAPEILRGHARACAATDLYSLSVLLFYLFMTHHPMEGKREREIPCLDLAAMQKLYGLEPLFIFDPKSALNRPVTGVHNNASAFWNLYPGYVRDVFTHAFTEGVKDPAARVKAGEWRAVLTRMRDQIFYCHKCGSENFLKNDDEASAPATDMPCWSCGETPIPPMRLRLGGHSVVLNQDTLLYAHHLDSTRHQDYSEVVAEMVPHPKKADVWGLKNLSPQPWTSIAPAGTVVEVATGKSVSLVPGLRIRFGKIEGVIG